MVIPENIKPKKSLGQNFLTDDKALEKIVAAGELSAVDNVLEIGPGTGVLTKRLLQQVGKVVAVEKDEKLARYLGASINDPKFRIIEGDILQINVPQLVEENNFQPYKVVANIPYYITGLIIRMFLEMKCRPSMMVLLVQKEVAERICEEPGQMSVLAVSVQYYGRPEFVAVVPKTSFHPVPEVDSAIVKIVIHPDRGAAESVDAEKEFFKLVKIGFSSRRKTLANNLSAGLEKDKNEIEEIIAKVGLDKSVRAQELDVGMWKQLVGELGNRSNF